MAETIIVKIAPNGNTHIEANGFTGVTCAEATQRLELLLGGGTAKKKDYKPEFSLPANSAVDTQTRL